MNTEREFVAIVEQRRLIADDVVALTLRDARGHPLPRWRPGAHIDVLLDDGLERQYSLCGDPADEWEWQIAVLREPAGRGGSVYVHDRLDVGARVRLRGPRNHFALVEAERYLFIAGGIGITPILPMVAAAQAGRANWYLVYGGRRRASMAFQETLMRYGDRAAVRPQDETGLLDLDTLLREPRDGTLVYCCGPEPLLAAVEERCGIWPPRTLHIERFAPKPVVCEGPDRDFEVEDFKVEDFEVELKRTGRTLTVPVGKSILQVVEESGLQVLSSCREGTCGTCETVVLDGRPEHRDSVLTEDERQVGDLIMICVSRSRDPRLVLDL
jgi:ferredoxin-NADP reductase